MFDWSQVFGKRLKRTDGMKKKISSVIKQKLEEWIAENKVKNAKQANQNLCEKFASEIVREVPGAEKINSVSISSHVPKHVFIKYKNKFYDSEAPSGVDRWWQLPFFYNWFSESELKKFGLYERRL